MAKAKTNRPVALLLWLLASVVLAFAGLVAAYLLEQASAWIWALLVTGGACGLASALVLALVVRRLAGPTRYLPWVALLTAVAAVGARRSLLAELDRDPMAAVTIDFLRLTMAASSVVWGAVALIWGAAILSAALEPGPGERRGVGRILAGAGAVTLALYSLGPLWALVGLRLNLWTLLGLAALAAVAYGVGALYRRVLGG